ncbi:unnamed protein product [Brassica oleracea var. botrytis]
MIGGFQKSKRIRNVSILECGTHQCRRLPKLRCTRIYVVHGNIYVVGGSRNNKDFGEVYNPKIQTWELLSPSVCGSRWIEKVCPLEHLYSRRR